MLSPRVLHPFLQPVVRGRFVRRYKRFFVDVEVDGVTQTAHTANTGAMTGMLIEGAPVFLTRHDNPKRKLALELEAIDVGSADAPSWVSCNTIRSNRVAEAFVRGGIFPELGPFLDVLREQPLGQSRVDLQLLHGADDVTFIEVKSVTLREGARALFPDAVSERATRHVNELARAARKGQRVFLLYLVQRSDVDVVAPARAVDVDYANAVKRAVRAGVNVVAAAVSVEAGGIGLAKRVQVELA